MNKRIMISLASLLIMLSILGAGCRKQIATAPMPDVGIPEEEMNTRIHLQAPDGLNSFKIGDIVGITVDVVSEDQIVFPSDYGAKILVLENQEWVEVPNLMKYPEGSFLLSPSKGDPFQIGAAGVDPILQETNQPVTVRIILIGNIYRDGQITDEQTAASIDVELTP